MTCPPLPTSYLKPCFQSFLQTLCDTCLRISFKALFLALAPDDFYVKTPVFAICDRCPVEDFSRCCYLWSRIPFSVFFLVPSPRPSPYFLLAECTPPSLARESHSQTVFSSSPLKTPPQRSHDIAPILPFALPIPTFSGHGASSSPCPFAPLSLLSGQFQQNDV